MTKLTYIENRFSDVYMRLSAEDIYHLEQSDNGPIINVVTNINKECFGTAIYEDLNDYTVDFFYITNQHKLQGDLIRIKLSDPDYVGLLFYFCQMLVIDYEKLDTLNTFNLYQTQIRSYLEKLGFFTTTNLELKKFEGKNVTMLSTAPKGVKNIILFDRVEYYRNFFGRNYSLIKSEGKDYTYLMLNDDTGLIKIGRSNNPKHREKTLQFQEPMVHMIACWETPKSLETDLHKLFKDKRVRGEWFRLTMANLKKLEEYMKSFN